MIHRFLTLSAVALVVAACGDAYGPNRDPDPASRDSVYTATSFTVSESGSVTNVLAAGGSLVIRLRSDSVTGDSTTTGTFLSPASLNGGIAIAYDMAGTWSRSGDTITFTQSADTFVRDADWLVNTTTLRTDFASGADTVRATLTLTVATLP